MSTIKHPGAIKNVNEDEFELGSSSSKYMSELFPNTPGDGKVNTPSGAEKDSKEYAKEAAKELLTNKVNIQSYPYAGDFADEHDPTFPNAPDPSLQHEYAPNPRISDLIDDNGNLVGAATKDDVKPGTYPESYTNRVPAKGFGVGGGHLKPSETSLKIGTFLIDKIKNEEIVVSLEGTGDGSGAQ
jgi:hypothetical protein